MLITITSFLKCNISIVFQQHAVETILDINVTIHAIPNVVDQATPATSALDSVKMVVIMAIVETDVIFVSKRKTWKSHDKAVLRVSTICFIKNS